MDENEDKFKCLYSAFDTIRFKKTDELLKKMNKNLKESSEIRNVFVDGKITKEEFIKRYMENQSEFERLKKQLHRFQNCRGSDD